LEVVEELYEESIEEDGVSLADGVLEGGFGAPGDDSGNDLMRRISLRNSRVGNGYMVNLLVKVTGG
ncbi:hypothetical protein Tco_1093204, partial [Tanacetum coccineum]